MANPAHLENGSSKAANQNATIRSKRRRRKLLRLLALVGTKKLDWCGREKLCLCLLHHQSKLLKRLNQCLIETGQDHTLDHAESLHNQDRVLKNFRAILKLSLASGAFTPQTLSEWVGISTRIVGYFGVYFFRRQLTSVNVPVKVPDSLIFSDAPGMPPGRRWRCAETALKILIQLLKFFLATGDDSENKELRELYLQLHLRECRFTILDILAPSKYRPSAPVLTCLALEYARLALTCSNTYQEFFQHEGGDLYLIVQFVSYKALNPPQVTFDDCIKLALARSWSFLAKCWRPYFTARIAARNLLLAIARKHHSWFRGTIFAVALMIRDSEGKNSSLYMFESILSNVDIEWIDDGVMEDVSFALKDVEDYLVQQQ